MPENQPQFSAPVTTRQPPYLRMQLSNTIQQKPIISPVTPGRPASVHANPNGIAQYLTDLDDLDNTIIQPTTSLPAVPVKLYKRIKDRDFVDLNALMPQTLYTLKGVNTTYKLRVHEQPGGADSISVDRNPSYERAIKSFLTCLEGWNVFARVTAYLYPEIAQHLIAYQDQIQSYNQNFPPDTRHMAQI